MSKNHFTTIKLSDTVDHWNRKVHINVRNDKPTMVYRWVSKDGRKHTQRTTMTDEQTVKLIGALSRGLNVAIGSDRERHIEALKMMVAESRFASDE